MSLALPVRYYAGRDGAQLAYREMGAGRALVLIHGLFSTATVNWVKYGQAAVLASRGYRVVMPDLRGHGDSAKPHDAAAYPPDVLADDGFALLDALGLVDYDLAGYSLGGRTALRMLARGARPGAAVIAGMGLEGILRTGAHSDYFRRVLDEPGTFTRGSREWMTEAFLNMVKGDPAALRRVLETFTDTPREALAGIDVPTLVVTGVDDHDNGSGCALAAALPKGSFMSIPGNHMSAVTKLELGAAIGDYLTGGRVAQHPAISAPPAPSR